MIGLDRIIEFPGVVAAGQFDEEGNITRSAGELENNLKEMSAVMAKDITKFIAEKVYQLKDKAPDGWDQLNGWAFWGGKHSFCVVGKTGVIVETTRTDFNELIVALLGEEPTGPRQMNH